jgi:hypothetical protein
VRLDAVRLLDHPLDVVGLQHLAEGLLLDAVGQPLLKDRQDELAACSDGWVGREGGREGGREV